VTARLEAEHEETAAQLERVDQATLALVSDEEDGMEKARSVMDLVTDALRSHLSSEERELVEPLARLGFF
jgi:hemerythrin-like domain-containing protein